MPLSFLLFFCSLSLLPTFLLNRRTDNTAGHIIKCPKRLQAGPLPPVHTSLTAGSTLPNKSFPTLERLSPLPAHHRSQSAAAGLDSNSSVISSSDSVSLLEVPSKLRSTLSSKTYPLTNPSSSLEGEDSHRGGGGGYYTDNGELGLSFHDENSVGGGSGGMGMGMGLSDDLLTGSGSVGGGVNDEGDDDDDDLFAHDPLDSPIDILPSNGQPSLHPSLMKSRSILISTEDNDELASDYFLLASRPIPVLGDNITNCLLRIYTTKIYNESLLIRLVMLPHTRDPTSSSSSPPSAPPPPRLLSERTVSIDQAYDYIHLSNIKPSTTEDLQSLRSMLVTMFQEVDTESNGYLTYDEFQLLMERIDVGITSQELRFVIAEADENENGYIDYHEFVPLAVDMIQAFRARSRAKVSQELLESTIEDTILHKVNHEDVQRITSIFFDKMKVYDVKGVYALRPSELRKCLKTISTSTGLSNSEINMIAQLLPRDAFGRLIYRDFRNILYQVKIAVMRNMVIEAQGNEIHHYLMKLCREEETQLLRRDAEYSNNPLNSTLVYDREDIESGLTGWLPLRSVINIMISSSRLSLTRLQVMVIASEAIIQDGHVNYLSFTPIAAKTIELMFEPKTLKQRAELIETSDLSPEVLLKGENPQLFLKRLKSLFCSYDLERKGELNSKQFRAILESMDLQLTSSEILSLMAIADENQNGFISFDEFCEFCYNNLLHLEREKHIRMLQKAIHGTVQETTTTTTLGIPHTATATGYHTTGRSGVGGSISSSNESGEGGGGGGGGGNHLPLRDVQTLELHLRQIFQLADHDKNGYLNQEELESLFLSLNIQLTSFQLMTLLSECDTNNNGLVEYEEFIPICVDILEASKAKNYALEQKLQRETEIKQKALAVYPSWEGDVKISTECLTKVLRIIESLTEKNEQRNVFIQAVKNPLNGLSRTEANVFIAEILRSKRQTSNMGGRDIIRDLLDKTTTTTMTMTASSTTAPSSVSSSTGGSGGGGGGGLPPTLSPLANTSSRYNRSYHEVFEIIKSIRLSTLMRGMLEGVHQSALAKHLLSRFADEAETIRKEKELDGPIFFLPVKSIVKILESTTTLRLHMAQILTLISWADSFQSPPGLGIDYRDFAYYAADVIAKMYDTNELQKRSNILAGSSTVIDDTTALRGATKESIEQTLKEEFLKISSSDGLVSAQACHEIIKSLPRLQLSDREVAAVLSSSSTSLKEENGLYHWEDFLPWAYGSIRAVCVERMIGRRVALIGVQSAHEEDHRELMKLGDRLIDISVVRKIGGNYSIAFVSETTSKNPRRSSLLPIRKKSEVPGMGGGGGPPGQHHEEGGGHGTTDSRGGVNHSNSNNNLTTRSGSASGNGNSSRPPQEVYDILRTSTLVPFRGNNIPKELLKTHPTGIIFLIRIAENDPVLCYDQPPLVIKALTHDCEYSFSLALNLRLPSLGLVDQEAAEQFAWNLTSRLYLQFVEGGGEGEKKGGGEKEQQQGGKKKESGGKNRVSKSSSLQLMIDL
jgi:Ca2+-binding EF-hand superfamily protein